jgi:hypothetical protein
LLDDPAGPGWTVGTGTSGVADVSGWAQFNRPRALEVTANGTANSCAARTATPVGNVVAGKSYALLAYHLGVSALASLSFAISWLDSSSNQIGAAVTTAPDAEVALNTAKKYAIAGVTAPAGAVAANLTAIFTRAGMTGGERYRITKICLVPGANPGDFVEP